MRKVHLILLALLTIAPVIVFAQPSTIVNLPQDSKNYNINYSDNYSLLTRTATYAFKYAKVSEVSGIISKSLSRYGSLSVNEALNMAVVCEEKDKLSNILQLCQQIDQPRMAEFTKFTLKRFDLKYLSPDRILGQLTPFLSPDGRIQADYSYNALWIYDHPSRLEEIGKVLALYDLPMKQILIDVEIVEISMKGLQENGLNWDKLLQSTAVTSAAEISRTNTASEILTRTDGTASSWAVGNAANVSVQQLRDIIRLLSEKGVAKIATTPKILTLNNSTSNIWYGKDIKKFPSVPSTNLAPVNPSTTLRDKITNPVIARSDSNASSSYYYSNSYYRDYYYYQDYYTNNALNTNRISGLNLSITPSIGSSNLFNMNISCEVTDLVGWTDDMQPLVQGQSINSRVIVKDNESFLLGQLTKTAMIEKDSKVPLLGTVLPFLFSRKTKSTDEVKVLILLTPHAVDINGYGLNEKSRSDLMHSN